MVETENRDKHKNELFAIEQIDLGTIQVGWNTLKARVDNLTDTDLYIQFELQAVPGLWFHPIYRKQFEFNIPAGQSQVIEAEYQYKRMSTEATLDVIVKGVVQNVEGLEKVQQF